MGIILDLLFPRKCVGCGQKGKYICPKCQKTIDSKTIDYKDKRFEGRIGLFNYDGTVKGIISLIKFGFVYDAIAESGQWISKVLKNDFPNVVKMWQKEKYTIVPVPLHWRRENWRGFNQAATLAKIVGKELKLPIDEEVVKRILYRKPQSWQKKKERVKNVENIFELLKKKDKLIIFDDVYTTGATVRNLVKVLPKKTRVWVLTMASGR